MPKHIPFPEIGQFRSAIHKVTCAARQSGVDINGDPEYDHTKVLPVLTYEGTVKCHGTNAAICVDRTVGEFWFQSRENVITLEKDNAGFVRHFHDKPYPQLFTVDGNVICIFGEWCGGSIQPNVALSKLSKRFVVFAILADGKWLSKEFVSKIKSEDIAVYNIYDYPNESITIDFNHPEYSQNKLVELTANVEKSCPVAKAMGVDGIGEGIVWKSVTSGWESPDFSFKIKGGEHSKSKVIQLKPIDVEKSDKFSAIAANVTPEWRLAQMLDKTCNLMNGGIIDRAKVGDFIKLVTADVVKEESLVLQDAGVTIKDITGNIAKISKNYFFEREKVQDKL